jgi:hypothetical protein
MCEEMVATLAVKLGTGLEPHHCYGRRRRIP